MLKTDYEVNIGFLVGYTITVALSTMQYTLATCEVGTAAAALQYQLGWGTTKSDVDLYTSIMATSSIIGITIGSLCGGMLIQYGRRWTIINFNIVGLLASLTMFTMHYKIMCLGRLLLGFAAGVLLCATPAMIDETIPTKLVD